jgi:hypothetical protein
MHHPLLKSLATLLLLSACAPLSHTPANPKTVAGTPAGASTQTAANAAPSLHHGTIPGIDRVLIISIDGLRPDLLLRGDTPVLHDLYKHGAFTFWARTTTACITLPSHVSMLTGVVPEVHAISWNADLPFKEPVYPAVPTIFELAKLAHLTTGMCAGKHKFVVFDKPGALDWKFIVPAKPHAQNDPNEPPDPKADDEVTAHAVSMIHDHRPQLMFVHLPNVDAYGHFIGWGSDEQLKAVAIADRCVGKVLQAERDANLLGSTLVIVTADHGGAGRTHGPDDPRSRWIPWIITGPHVRQNLDLTRLERNNDVQTFDTFATACAVLGLHWPITDPVVGKFMIEAFDTNELLLSTYEPRMTPSTDPSMESTTEPSKVPATDPATQSSTQPDTLPNDR